MERIDAREEAERLAWAHARLREALVRRAPRVGIFSAAIPGAGIARRDGAGFSEHRFDRPVASLLVQGAKETTIGGNLLALEEGQVLTVCMDMPSSSRIIQATPERPLLTFFFQLDRQIINELLPTLPWRERDPGKTRGIAAAKADADFMEAMLRLLHILDRPAQIPARSDLALRDLHYLLLTGPQGSSLRAVYDNSRHGGRLFEAIDYLRAHLDRSVGALELARAAHMSESSLYRGFKALTGFSPLQYHKQLRLHEARRLIIAENEQAGAAAYRTGYESVSQFSREYRKLFGQPPGRSKKQG